jgi:hypothetical protein
MTFLKAAAFALALTAFGATPAVAQEQENPSTPGQIPDPSTYQGSTVLQQQSDQQDQQFRQQQQYAPQNGGQNSGGNYGSRSYGQAPPLTAFDQCKRMLTQAPSFAVLRGLVALGSGQQDPRYFAISRRPTATEKTALMRWRAGRRRCNTSYPWSPNPVVQQVEMMGVREVDNMIAALEQGRMTYGQFNYQIAQKSAAFSRFTASH